MVVADTDCKFSYVLSAVRESSQADTPEIDSGVSAVSSGLYYCFRKLERRYGEFDAQARFTTLIQPQTFRVLFTGFGV